MTGYRDGATDRGPAMTAYDPVLATALGAALDQWVADLKERNPRLTSDKVFQEIANKFDISLDEPCHPITAGAVMATLAEAMMRLIAIDIPVPSVGAAPVVDICLHCPHPASEHAWLYASKECNHRGCPCPGLGEK